MYSMSKRSHLVKYIHRIYLIEQSPAGSTLQNFVSNRLKGSSSVSAIGIEASECHFTCLL